MNTTQFVNRHISMNEADTQAMLEAVGVESMEELIEKLEQLRVGEFNEK